MKPKCLVPCCFAMSVEEQVKIEESRICVSKKTVLFVQEYLRTVMMNNEEKT